MFTAHNLVIYQPLDSHCSHASTLVWGRKRVYQRLHQQQQQQQLHATTTRCSAQAKANQSDAQQLPHVIID